MKSEAVSQKILVKRKVAKRQQGRRRLKITILIFLSAVALIVAYRSYNSSEFTINTVRITGIQRIREKDVMEAASISKDDLLTRVSATSISNKIFKKNHWIEKVDVEKIWPSVLLLNITERNPVVKIKIGKSVWLMDYGGVLLRSRVKKKDLGLPTFVSKIDIKQLEEGQRLSTRESVNALRSLRLFPLSLRKKIVIIRATSISGLNFEMGEGARIYYGEAKYCGAKNLIVKRLLDGIESKGEKLDYIDIRVPSRPACRIRQG